MKVQTCTGLWSAHLVGDHRIRSQAVLAGLEQSAYHDYGNLADPTPRVTASRCSEPLSATYHLGSMTSISTLSTL